jgi:hypothetical protein
MKWEETNDENEAVRKQNRKRKKRKEKEGERKMQYS